MRKYLFWIPILILLAATLPAPGQLFFKKKPVAAPQVPELIQQLTTDPDEARRAQAAEKLREFDASQHQEIIPVLVAALKDPRASVRLEAVQSLGKIRPVTQAAGQALEDTAHNDDNFRVRWQAKAVLVSYNWAGYRQIRNDPSKGQLSNKDVPVPAPLPLSPGLKNEGPIITNVPSVQMDSATLPKNLKTVPSSVPVKGNVPPAVILDRPLPLPVGKGPQVPQIPGQQNPIVVDPTSIPIPPIPVQGIPVSQPKITNPGNPASRLNTPVNTPAPIPQGGTQGEILIQPSLGETSRPAPLPGAASVPAAPSPFDGMPPLNVPIDPLPIPNNGPLLIPQQ